MARFSFEKTIRADIGSVFDVFSRYEDYPNIVPQHYSSVRLRSVRGDTAIVEEHMHLGPRELVIMAKHVSQRPALHEVFVIGGDIRGSHFRERFVAGQEGTRLVADADIRLGIYGLFGRYQRHYERMLCDLARCCEA